MSRTISPAPMAARSRPTPWFFTASAVVLAAATACAPPPVEPKKTKAAAQVISAGELRVARLTRTQYGNTLRDLLGEDPEIAEDLPFDPIGDSGFPAPGNVGAREARTYMDLAERAAGRAARRLGGIAGCDVEGDEAGCAKPFARDFARRAFRRPLTAEETADIDRLYSTFRTTGGYGRTDALRLVIAAVLQAPSFLYRWEQGPDLAAPNAKTGLVALNAYELASRLSYFLWGSMPDPELTAAADSGDLLKGDALARQAERLLADPRARATIYDFHAQWLGLTGVQQTEKDPAVYPKFNDLLRNDMAAETRAFLDFAFTDGDAKIDTLFGAPFSFLNDRLANDVYSVKGVKGSDEYQKKDLPPAQRGGLFTHASFLATHAYAYDSAPVKRGLAIRERLLCQPVPPPPPELMVTPPIPDPNLSVREQFSQHSSDLACAGCHTRLDPFGFAFETYDGIGRYRTKSGPAPVDASGVVTGVTVAGNPEPGFANALEMLSVLRATPELRHCVVTQWMRFALGRVEEPADKPSLDAAYAAFEAAAFDVRALIVALVDTPSFRYRSVAAGEEMATP